MVVEALHRSAVELCFQFLYESFRIAGYIAPLGDIAANDTVRILDRALLPATVLVAEVDFDTQDSLKLLVPFKQKVIVSRHRLHFGKPPFDAQKRTMHVGDRDVYDLFDEGDAAPAVSDGEEDPFPAFSGHDEVSLDIPDPHPRIDICGSLVNEGAL